MARTVWILLIVVFAVGSALGFVFGSARGPGPLAVAPEIEEPEWPRGRRMEVVEPPPVTSSPGETLESLVASLPKPEVERGDGGLTGTVKDTEGRPVPGVLIHATRQDSHRSDRRRRRAGVFHERDLEEVVRDALETHLRYRARRRETRTDASGSFRLEGLPEATWYVRGYQEGYRLKVQSRRPKTGDRVEILAEPIYALTVRLRLPDGTEPETASIRIHRGGGWGGSAWTPRDPWVELEPGTKSLSAVAGEHQEFESDRVTVTVEKGRTPEPIDLELRAIRMLRGTVSFPPGERANLRVALHRLGEGEELDPATLVHASRSTYAHGHGSRVATFSFRDLEAGTYAVGLVLHHSELVTHELVEIRDGLVEKNLTLPPLGLEESFVVEVVGPDGKPPPQASFTTGYERENSRYGGDSPRSVRLPDGTWRVARWKPPSNMPPGGTHFLTVSVSGWGTERIEVDPRTASRLSVAFETPATLEVTVADYEGSGMEGKLQVQLSVRGSFQHQGPRLSSEGKATFTDLAPGAYTLTLSLRDARSMRQIAQHEINLVSGENRETLPLPTLHRVTILVENPSIGHVQLRPTDHQRRLYFNQRAPEGGRVVYEGVPDGDYTVYGYGGEGGGSMPVTVRGDTVVRFSPVVQDSYQVTIQDASGTMARAGLRTGDLIVGLDGTLFENLSKARALFTLAKDRERCVLTILRGGRRHQLTVRPLDVWASNKARGGYVTGVKR